MDVFLLLLVLIVIFSTKFYKKKFNYDFLERNQTLCINGIFVILVFLRHVTDYFDTSSSFNQVYNLVDSYLNQLIVTTFLFYSGYGIYESIKNKDNYVDTKLPKRIKKLYFNFLIVVISFLVMNLFLNIKYDIKTIILSLFAWETIGNSNWYMFAIMVMYLITYGCFKFFKDNKLSLIAITLFGYLFIIFLIIFKECWWYNTVICFILGLWVSYYKDKILKLLTGNNYTYIFCLIIAILNFYTFSKFRFVNLLYYECWAILFVILIFIISLKFKIYSKVLLFLGKYTFWIYIIQRAPMIFFDRYDMNNYLFVILSFVFTLVIGIIYDKIFNKNYFKELLYKSKEISNLN